MKKLITAASFILLCVFASHAQDRPELDITGNPNAPEIKFENLTYEYGKIKKDANGDCAFKFKNTGKQPLVITDATAQCGCTKPKFSKEPIMPGKTGVIQVHYDTSKIGQFTKQITVTSNAKSASVVLTIKGEVLPVAQ